MLKRSTLVSLSLLVSLALAAPAFAAVTPEQKCASAKMKAVGKKFAARAKCYAKALSQSVAVDAACLTLAETKFTGAFDKADDGDCLHEGDAAVIEGKIDVTLEDIVGDIGCGNGVTEGDEECDDGNVVDGDDCSSTCTASACGNGVVQGAEECDDGNQAAGDGCAGTCAVEPGFDCTGQPSICSPTCGDGIVAMTESCDDGNLVSNDGCDSSCSIESGYSCFGFPSVCTATCGDGIIAGAEGCDDGNFVNGDGCSNICAEEPGYDCTGSPSVCVPTCGNAGASCSLASECCSMSCSFAICD